MHGTCPKCGQAISRVNCADVDIQVAFGNTWKGISYNCPHCNVVLNVQMDPIAIKTDTVSELFQKLRK